MAPKLNRNCNSWTVISKVTGKAIFETFNERAADAINLTKYEVMPTDEYLFALNRVIRAANTQRG